MAKIGKKFKLSEISVLYSLSILVFLVAIGLSVWFGYWHFSHSSLPPAIVGIYSQDNLCKYQRTFDGVCVDSQKDVNPKLIAVMIDNHMDARPPEALSKASVVYEAPVEGNFTRFMAVYPADLELKMVGPIRSARSYYLDWLSEYGDILYVHVGGSPEALAEIKTYGISDLNEFYRGWYFWRDTYRYAPHNAFISSEFWNKALVDYPDLYQNDKYESWKFGKIEKCQSECVKEITINFSSFSFEAIWKYNTSTEQYERYQSGYLHKDKDGGQIVTDTLIVEKVESEVYDAVGRLEIETIGSGEAIVFVGGKVIEGEWKKESRESRTRWFDKDGNEIDLQAGKIWIEVANERTSIEYDR